MIPWFGQEGHNRANANEKDRICVHALRYETGAWPLWQRGQWPGHGDAAGHGDVARPAMDAAGHGAGYAMQPAMEMRRGPCTGTAAMLSRLLVAV